MGNGFELMFRYQQTVETCLDGFRKNDQAQILSCLTDDIEWAVFGAFHLTGKEAYDAAIEGPGFISPPRLEVVRMVEEGDVRDGKICERRAWVIELKENDHR
ncbi:nuclear transport factor 2 family protein [Nonomuraea purpurea]|uniref:Nuclear transport factor 2 family protein n=1 Tax=Nonomuraea purpurea TaxID=1849276 RepID=A0ABV8GMV1_9ACTN